MTTRKDVSAREMTHAAAEAMMVVAKNCGLRSVTIAITIPGTENEAVVATSGEKADLLEQLKVIQRTIGYRVAGL